MAAPSLAVVIPCYNCGATIVDVVQGVRQFTDQILIVNDGSQDESHIHIEQCQTRTIAWENNRGKGSALLAGFDYWLAQPGWEVLVTLDSDGQHCPSDLSRFLQAYQRIQPI
jgi:glycosyltransferase involved in cell wall biosynthesis